MSEIKAVYDTNILVSAFIGKGAPYKALVAVFEGKVRLILSPDIMLELEDVISRPKFRYDEKQIRKILTVIFQASQIVEPDIFLDIVKEDPSDNRIIEAAISGGAKYIVTGDSHLLNLKEIDKIKIIPVREFLKLV